MTAGGGGDTTMAVAEGSLTKRPGGTPRRCLGGDCTMTAIVVTKMAVVTVTAAATTMDVNNIEEDNNKDDNIDDNEGEDDQRPGDDGFYRCAKK